MDRPGASDGRLTRAGLLYALAEPTIADRTEANGEQFQYG